MWTLLIHTERLLCWRRGHTDTVQNLIDRGADLDDVDNDGKSALMMAAERGHDEIIQILIDAGANVNAADKWGWTALTLAKYPSTVEILKKIERHSLNSQVS
jgi:ankyrin repeat protein